MVLSCSDDGGMPAAASSAGRTLPAAVQAASEFLTALASPLRLSIVALLDEHGSRCVHQLVDALGVPQPLVSQHLRVLRSAGLVAGVRRHRRQLQLPRGLRVVGDGHRGPPGPPRPPVPPGLRGPSPSST